MSTATLNRTRAAALRTDVREVVSYNRISKFRQQVGNRSAVVDKGVDRQEADAVSTAREFELPDVTRHYTDNDKSASEFSTDIRDEWLELLEHIATGTVSHVLVWVLDRIIRDPNDLEALLRLCRDNGAVIIQTATGSVVNPHDPESVMHARITGAVAAYESAKTSMRARRKHAQMAADGKPHGGRRRYGYEQDMTALREPEAAIVRELVGRLLAGESLYRLATDLEARGVSTAEGGKWTGSNLGIMLRRPHLAGLRVHHGEVVGEAAWPAIITRAQHEQVVALLSETGRRSNKGSNARKYLLGGLAVCDECGAPIKSKPRSKRGDAAAYICQTGRHVSRSMEVVDAIVEAAVVQRLARMDASGLLEDDTQAQAVAELRSARTALDQRYDDVEAEHAAGSMTTRAYSRATARLEADMDQLDAQIRDASALLARAPRVLEGATGEAAAAVWADLGLDRRRAIIDALAEVRLIGGKRPWRPEDVVINWR